MTIKKTEKLDVSKQKIIEKLFSKEQLLAAERFQARKDMVNALLSPDKQYTVQYVEEMIQSYMKGTVM